MISFNITKTLGTILNYKFLLSIANKSIKIYNYSRNLNFTQKLKDTVVPSMQMIVFFYHHITSLSYAPMIGASLVALFSWPVAIVLHHRHCLSSHMCRLSYSMKLSVCMIHFSAVSHIVEHMTHLMS